MVTLAHLSDPHLGPVPRPRLGELAGKRLLGFANWQRRRRIYRAEVLAALMADLEAAQPDHIVVTGDLVNIALESEFAPAALFLERLGPPDRVTYVPGNHDAYVGRAVPFIAHHWDAYMRGDAEAGFPFVRRRGPLALIGLSTAVPSAPFMATGRLGPAQLGRLAQVLEGLRSEPLFRVLLIHHPPAPTKAKPSRRLIDWQGLGHVLARQGVDLILHGHDHVHSLMWIEGPQGRIPAVGVPSASAMPGSRHDAAAYNLYAIGGEPGAWRVSMVSRGLRAGEAGVVEFARRDLIV